VSAARDPEREQPGSRLSAIKSFALAGEISETAMMRRFLPILLCALHLITGGTAARAQELDPLLAPHAEVYNSGLADLQKNRKAQLAACETEYVQKLDAAMSRAKDESAVAMLRKEREGVVKGLLAPSDPTAFPEEIATARKAFFNGVGKASLEYSAAKKKLDDAYLKTLAGLAKQAKGKNAPPGLASQVAAEKKRVTTGS
jgi:hypothetical protein